MKKKMLFGLLLIFSLSAKSQLLSWSDWETGDILQNWTFYPYSLAYTSYTNYPNGYSARIDSSFAYSGRKCIRFQLRSTDSMVASGKRAEIYTPRNQRVSDSTYWIAWSQYLPLDYKADRLRELHLQISTSSAVNPNVAIWLVNDNFSVNFKYDSAGTGRMVERNFPISSPKAIKGRWVRWILYYKPGLNNTGRTTLYRDRVVVFDRIGANANRVNGQLETTGKYFKLGIYKWPWNTPGIYNPNQRILYYDDVRFYGKNSTINDVW